VKDQPVDIISITNNPKNHNWSIMWSYVCPGSEKVNKSKRKKKSVKSMSKEKVNIRNTAEKLIKTR
jgi:hypothetical protein